MGYDNQHIPFTRKKNRDKKSITIVGPKKPHQRKRRRHLRLTEANLQTELNRWTIYREAITKDRDTEKVRRRYSRHFDVRYMTSLKNLKDKLLSTYACDQNRCPIIRERLNYHNQSSHGPKLCERTCSLPKLVSKSSVSIRAGPDFDQYSDQKCIGCASPNSSRNSNNYDTCREPTRYNPNSTKQTEGNSKNKAENCEGCTLRFTTKTIVKTEDKNGCNDHVDTTEKKPILNKNRNHKEFRTNFGTHRYKSASFDTKNNFDKCSHCSKNTSQIRKLNGSGCTRKLDGTDTKVYMRSGKSVNGCTNSINIATDKTKNYETTRDVKNPDYVDDCTAYTPYYRDACTEYDNAAMINENDCVPYNIPPNVCTRNKKYTDSCSYAHLKPECSHKYTTTYNNSFVGNIEASRLLNFPLADNNKNTFCNNTHKSSNGIIAITKTNQTTNTPIKIDKGNYCAMEIDKFGPYKDLYPLDEFQENIISPLISMRESRIFFTRNQENLLKHTSVNSQITNNINNDRSHFYKTHNSVRKPSNDKSNSEVQLKNYDSKTKEHSHPIYKIVREWICEIPMQLDLYEKNTDAIKQLISDLYNLLKESENPGYDEKLRNAINVNLTKIPILLPGPKGKQSGFKRNLVSSLIKKIKSLSYKNASTSYSKLSRNAVTEVHTSLMSCNHSFNKQFTNNARDDEIKTCIIAWLRLIYQNINKIKISENQLYLLADFVSFRIDPLLNKKLGSINHKANLKSTILNIMYDLPIVTNYPINIYLRMPHLTENLANKLICIHQKYVNTHICSNYSLTAKSSRKYYDFDQREAVISFMIRKCLEDANIDCNDSVIKEAGDIIYDCYKNFNDEDGKGQHQARKELMKLLITSTNLSEAQAWKFTKLVITEVSNLFNEKGESVSSKSCSRRLKSCPTSVYTTMEANPFTYLVTSTPKKKRFAFEAPKLSPHEIEYMKNVGNLIRSWMSILPESFSAPDDHLFKETMINDLAGDLMDRAKLDQLATQPKISRHVKKFIVERWIYRLGVFEDTDLDDEIECFLDKLEEIPIPELTKPFRGNRQEMENIKFNEASPWAANYVPKGTVVLEDEISLWIHEQPSDIFFNDTEKNKQVRELAQLLGNNLGKNRLETEVSKDISQWLCRLVKPEKQGKIKDLSENLKNRVLKLPQDDTLANIVDNRVKDREEYRKMKLEEANTPKIYTANESEESFAKENEIAMFISKFIDHHYDIDDPLARRAFNTLLYTHLLPMKTPERQEIYGKFEKKELNENFPPTRLIRELEYIKDISDWLKNIPIDPSFHTVGNRDRIEFVNSLAYSIREIEEDWQKDPNAMDYEIYMGHIIVQHVNQLPLTVETRSNLGFMIWQLVQRIIAHRQNVSDSINANESINSTGINSQNIGDFIEEFIEVNGADIAHDEVKMEAWAIRLIREINKMISQTNRIPKAEVYARLIDFPVPSDETAMYFDLELKFVKDITSWMKNLPFLPMNDSEKDTVTNKVCDLAEHLVEFEKMKKANPDNNFETDLNKYISQWITELPLNKSKDIVVPVIIQQLLNRINKTTNKDVSSELNLSDTNIPRDEKKGKSSWFDLFWKAKEPNSKNVADAIEKWSQALPITHENESHLKNLRNDISIQMFQEVAQLSLDPEVNNNDILFKDKLGDKIDSIFENLPQNNDLENKKENLKVDILDTLVDLRSDIRKKIAGETYKKMLEKTIDSSVPSPIPCNQVFDPGFEIYKDRLAAAFILDNFDHGFDAVKTKYETMIKKEIDKYFSHATNRNGRPLSNDQLYNELYSALFRVPIPNEISVIKEVEKTKTRCEIDAWFEELPMREANNLNELLEWDKILSTLATRIHEIEISEPKPDDKIFREIMKWLVKFPLQSGNNHEEFAKKLQEQLKSTADSRKCVLYDPKAKNKKGKTKAKVKSTAKAKNSKEVLKKSNPNAKTVMTSSKALTKSPRKNAADEICSIVDNWCQELPINTNNQEQLQMMKNEITVKILIKLSELNSNAEVFHNDSLYDYLFTKEIEKILSDFPTTCSFNNNRERKVQQLLNHLNSIKPQITEEKATHKHKQDLIHAVDKILDSPQTDCPTKNDYLDAVKSNIIDDFIQYKYSNDDDEKKQTHKASLQENISKYTLANSKCDSKVDENGLNGNPLMQTNQVISELAKILPSDNDNNILIYEVEEVRMKKEVTDFFNEIGLTDKVEDMAKLNYFKESLTKKLKNLEDNGYSPDTEIKMKQEIMKCLKKLDVNKNEAVIDAFVAKLKSNEMSRRMPQKIEKEVNVSVSYDGNRKYPSKNACTQQFLPSSSQNIPARRTEFVKKSSKYLGRTVDHKRDDDDENDYNYVNNVGSVNIQEEIELEEIRRNSGEEFSDAEHTECFCKNVRSNRRNKLRPYCMMPIPMRYLCQQHVPNAYWCGMPFTFF